MINDQWCVTSVGSVYELELIYPHEVSVITLDKAELILAVTSKLNFGRLAQQFAVGKTSLRGIVLGYSIE